MFLFCTSLKVFSQIGQYATYLTSTDILVESPHDYQELNISSRYTTRFSNEDYFEKATNVLFRRLKLHGYANSVDESDKKTIEKTLKAFFPTYKKQDERIKIEEMRIREGYRTHGRGNRENDDIRRYAIPNYIRSLAGKSKSKLKFRYAGLETIIHISSGIIRYLLDSAAKMYDVTVKDFPVENGKSKKVDFIPTEIQNRVLRDKADHYLFVELPKSSELNEYNQSSGMLLLAHPIYLLP